MTFIVATSIGFPEQYYPQKVLAAALRKFIFTMELDFDLEQIDRFFNNVKIEGRYFALPIDSLLDPVDFAVTISKALEICLNIAESTINKLLQSVNLQPNDISLLTSVSLTPAVPSLEARLMSRIPFSSTIKRMPINGVGCMGGAIGISRVADYLQGHPNEAAVLFAIELSSALWQGSLQADLTSMIRNLPDNPGVYSDIIMNIITAALFGDGCGAVLMVGRDHPLAKSGLPQIIDNRSFLLANTVELMGLELVDSGFRNILRPEVSDYVNKGLLPLIDSLLVDHNLKIEDISRWIVHPGGPKIINTIEAEFGLNSQALQLSRDTLAAIGNISSGTVLYMLDKILSEEQIPASSFGLMVAMVWFFPRSNFTSMVREDNMLTKYVFLGIIFAVILQRLVELRISKNNEIYILNQGGKKHSDNLLGMVKVLQVSWCIAAITEVWYLHRPFILPLSAVALSVTLIGQVLRYLSMKALERRWTLPIMTLPNMPVVDQGIYRYLRHPNWLGVTLEIAALPLIHGAYLTAIIFSLANALLMSQRVQAEEKALYHGF